MIKNNEFYSSLFSGLLTKYHGLKPLLVGVPYPVVYEIPAKRNQYPLPHKYPDHDFGHISDPYLDSSRYSDQVVYNRIPENQPPTKPKYSNYDLSEVEKKMVDNYREHRDQSGQGFYSNSTPGRRLYSRDQGGQGGLGGQGGQGRQGGQGEQLGPSGYSRAPTRDTIDISEYE